MIRLPSSAARPLTDFLIRYTTRLASPLLLASHKCSVRRITEMWCVTPDPQSRLYTDKTENPNDGRLGGLLMSTTRVVDGPSCVSPIQSHTLFISRFGYTASFTQHRQQRLPDSLSFANAGVHVFYRQPSAGTSNIIRYLVCSRYRPVHCLLTKHLLKYNSCSYYRARVQST